MVFSLYDPDTGFTFDVGYEDYKMSLLWRFCTPHSDNKFRSDPKDSLAECPTDSWLLQWKEEGATKAEEVLCAPMLAALADECAHLAEQTHDKHNAEWTLHWSDATKHNLIAGVRGAMRHCELAMKEDGAAWVSGLLSKFCEKARGVL